MAKKLSVASVQQALLEADEARKTSYATMKANGQRMRTVSSINDPSTKITNIKQVVMPKEQKRESDTHEPFVMQADMAGDYVDRMPRGEIFSEDNGSGVPKTPPVSRMRPNQRTRLEQVSPNMQKGKRKSEAGSSQLWDQAEMADKYVDPLPRGNVFSEDEPEGGDRLAGGKIANQPAAKDLHGTTRPTSSRKTLDLTRWPHKDQPAPGEPSKNYPQPKDAPPKRSWDKVKSGVLVRVNESVKARFDIVSESVLKRMASTYRQHGYRVVVESSGKVPAWRHDQRFQKLVYETVAAKENQNPAFYRKLAGAALNRLYHLCQNDYNNLYESREDFLKTLRTAFAKILENAIVDYRKGLDLYVAKARVVTEASVNEVEIIAEGDCHQMALRLIRNKLMEQFGLGADIKFIFVDGTKYIPDQIREWVPRVRV